ncbi:DNA adenine methylase [Haladaptatus cibarius]|uniref:DNA adenine methylase n=1 Tax=Haladaptatus cibarius TaxID=453847 RepID=UPI00067926FD|nr:Dam family site-specific DNA-(adenine-N6)-methyltransferase [Haladaptatus cibarius]
MAEPVLKWAGGKRQILHEIRACFPPESDVDAYHEPFFGGGALFFKTGPHSSGTINDINERLMSFYRVVRDSPNALIEVLEEFDGPESDPDPNRKFSKANRKGKEVDQYYYQQRELYNRRPNGEEYDEVEEAALLMYLNRTCYNGLYRENNSGEFNVPIGRHSSADWVQASRIMNASRALADIGIYYGDFSYVLDHATEDDLVYFDPPYEPVSHTSSFVEYSSKEFDTEEQERLSEVAVELNEIGAHVVVSNSPPMRDLYQYLDEFRVHDVGAKRHINSDGEGRGKVGEIIVTNVPEDNRREKTAYLDQFVETDTGQT